MLTQNANGSGTALNVFVYRLKYTRNLQFCVVLVDAII